MTIREAVHNAEAKLISAGVANARLDAEVLIAHILNKNRAWVVTHVFDVLDEEANREYEAACDRRTRREPLQYILGMQEFWGLEFRVTPDVLIPRPETELVVESALAIAKSLGRQTTIVDLGTGSGCIAISLAKELPSAYFFAIDASEKALVIARDNSARHNVSERIRFLRGDLLEPLAETNVRGQIDILVSNPPYVRSGDRCSLQSEVRDYEPEAALFPGPCGTEMHQRIIAAAPDYLRRHGALIMEMGMGQAGVLREMFSASGEYTAPVFFKDLAGIERVVTARKA